ncbi:MAG: adenylyltransferase/cytidyltransferase family protein [Verrucomicrobiota bacterium]
MNPSLPTPPLAADLVERRKRLRADGKTLVFTNGCFDLVHPGHVSYLKEAAAMGDELWIGINGDGSVRALKGDKRPILSESERAYLLRAFSFVAEVFVFPEMRLTEEIRIIRPDIYVKAGDYTLESLDKSERAAFEEVGSSIVFVPFLEGFSTSAMIGRIKEAF